MLAMSMPEIHIEQRITQIERDWTQDNTFNITREDISWLIRTVKKFDYALNRIPVLTHSWVIAEQTINCRHTYAEIREVVRKALEKE